MYMIDVRMQLNLCILNSDYHKASFINYGFSKPDNIKILRNLQRVFALSLSQN